jgi:hypothetical protein
LQALYAADQAEEASHRQTAAEGYFSRTPASEWRWMMYGPVAPPSPLYSALRDAGLVDPGTGSTWQALEARGLCQCRYVPDAFGVQLLQVQITKLRRKVIRMATGEQRPKQLPKGTLRERQWAALVRLYQAGDAGEPSDDLQYGPGSFDWYKTLRRLIDYQPKPLIEASNGEWIDGYFHRHDYPYYITAFGRAYYEQEWQRYRELYPDVEAPEPKTIEAGP